MPLLSLLFPPYCISCQKITRNSSLFYRYLCPNCLKKIFIEIDNICPICGEANRLGQVCINCKNKSFLDGIIVSSDYKNPITKELVHYLKYRYLKELSLPLAWLIYKKLANFDWQNQNDWLISSVPLSRRRLRFRGFNQADLIAKNLSSWLGISYCSDIIERVSFRSPQAEIQDYNLRRKNIKNAFRINSRKSQEDLEKLKKKKIILVDDVCTTGATLEECAKVLKPYAKEVWGCVVAK